MTKGTILLIPFPFTDLSGQKVRPAIVLYNHKNSEDCIVAFISSNPKKVGKYDLSISPSKENGLKVKSSIVVSKIATLDKKMAIGRLGNLEKTNLENIDQKLKEIFGLK